ncbi:DNA-directed DNA polymerase epsilon, subunit B [Sorochytrium milnesiophthora]
MSTTPLAPLIVRVFQKRLGLTVQKKAAKYLESALTQYNVPPEELEATLELIAHACKKQGSNYVVTEEALALTVQQLLHSANGGSDVYVAMEDVLPGEGAGPTEDVNLPALLHVVDALAMPRWYYSSDQKTFRLDTTPAQTISDAEAKAKLFRERHDLIKQRILRNDLFRPSTLSSVHNDKYFNLTSISSLRGSEGASFVVFGMLSQLDDGKYHLEDTTGTVEINLSEVRVSTGLFTEGCFVIAEGVYTEDKVFKVRTVGMPPPEQRSNSTATFGQIDFLGAPADLYDTTRLAQIEQRYDGVKIVLLSDVWLDLPSVMLALRRLFQGYAATVPPLAFVLMGNFVSKNYLYDGQQRNAYKEHWNALVDLILQYPEVANASTFIFVPGPEDPWGGHVLPRPPVPAYFTQRVQSRIPRAIFASNPVRIKYCTQEIVVMRDNLFNRMHRNCVISPNEEHTPETHKHLARTIIDQASLSPLPIHVRPVYWGAAHSLQLYPLPDAIVLADKVEQYTVEYENVQVMNPGSFATSDFSFLVYYPSTRSVELSQIPNDGL